MPPPVALALLAAALQGPLDRSALWHDVGTGQSRRWDGRQVVMTGTVLARHRGTVVLLRNQPVRDADGGWDYDRTECVGLMVTGRQFRSLREGRRISVRGTFLAIDLGADGGTATFMRRFGRPAYPDCASGDFVAPIVYVDRIGLEH